MVQEHIPICKNTHAYLHHRFHLSFYLRPPLRLRLPHALSLSLFLSLPPSLSPSLPLPPLSRSSLSLFPPSFSPPLSVSLSLSAVCLSVCLCVCVSFSYCISLPLFICRLEITAPVGRMINTNDQLTSLHVYIHVLVRMFSFRAPHFFLREHQPVVVEQYCAT